MKDQTDSQSRGHVLLISQDVVGTQMAGPGIRYYHLARILSREFPVVLAVPDDDQGNASKGLAEQVSYRRSDWTSIKPWVDTARVVIFPSDIASDFPQLADTRVPLVVDGYDPMLSEWLSLTRDQDLATHHANWSMRMCLLNQQYLLGDFFICASERQRDWWLGLLEANGRINPYTYREDPSLRSLVDVVPYGLPEQVPQHTRWVVKGQWQGIGITDRVILWGGGLWSWLDPLTAIRAMDRIWQYRQDVRLVFPGTRRPNQALKGIPTLTKAARDLAEQLGLLDKSAFFRDWVPYDDWTNVLLESDVALVLDNADTLEAHLAFRSRVLEYIWAGLPIIATRGAMTSDLIEQYSVGRLVEAGNVDDVANAILQLLNQPRDCFTAGVEKARSVLSWARVAEPLLEFCRHPHLAPDRLILGQNIGNPYYSSQVSSLSALVRAYERRRAVRLLDQLQRIKRTFRHE